MSSLPPGDRHPFDGRHRHRIDHPHDHIGDDDPAYAGETLDGDSAQIEMYMSNPPTAQATSSGMEVTDGGTERESSSHKDDQSNDDAEDDSSSGGSLPPVDATGASVRSPFQRNNGTCDAAARTRAAPHVAGEPEVEA